MKLCRATILYIRKVFHSFIEDDAQVNFTLIVEASILWLTQLNKSTFVGNFMFYSWYLSEIKPAGQLTYPRNTFQPWKTNRCRITTPILYFGHKIHSNAYYCFYLTFMFIFFWYGPYLSTLSRTAISQELVSTRVVYSGMILLYQYLNFFIHHIEMTGERLAAGSDRSEQQMKHCYMKTPTLQWCSCIYRLIQKAWSLFGCIKHSK